MRNNHLNPNGTFIGKTKWVLFFYLLPFLWIVPSHAQEESTTVGGYGELHYNDPRGEISTLDFHRFVIYLDHSFNGWIAFKSEMEIEHTKLEAGSSDGELAIEQAYLDLKYSDRIGLRIGIMLPPIGIMNEVHEPPTFHGVERPNFDRNLIPTTWRESGIGIYGTLRQGLKYKLYLLAGLKAAGFSGGEGIREGRQEATESSVKNPSLTGKLEYVPMAGLKIGGSFWIGNSYGEVDTSGRVTLLSMDVQYNTGPLQLRAVGALINIGDTNRLNVKFGKTGTEAIGSELNGAYLEAAYNFLSLLLPDSYQELFVFARLETYNTQSRMAKGYVSDPTNHRTERTFGFTYRPVPKVALKVDYQIFENAVNHAGKNQLNAGMGYLF